MKQFFLNNTLLNKKSGFIFSLFIIFSLYNCHQPETGDKNNVTQSDNLNTGDISDTNNSINQINKKLLAKEPRIKKLDNSFKNRNNKNQKKLTEKEVLELMNFHSIKFKMLIRDNKFIEAIDYLNKNKDLILNIEAASEINNSSELLQTYPPQLQDIIIQQIFSKKYQSLLYEVLKNGNKYYKEKKDTKSLKTILNSKVKYLKQNRQYIKAANVYKNEFKNSKTAGKRLVEDYIKSYNKNIKEQNKKLKEQKEQKEKLKKQLSEIPENDTKSKDKKDDITKKLMGTENNIKIIKSNIDNIDKLLQLGEAYKFLGQNGNAKKCYNQFLKLDKIDFKNLISLISHIRNNSLIGDNNKSKEYFKKLIKLIMSDDRFLSLKIIEDIEEIYKNYIEDNSKELQIEINNACSALIIKKNKNIDTSINKILSVEKIIKKHQSKNIGSIKQVELKEFDNAKRTKFIEENKISIIKDNLIPVYIKLGKYDEAIKIYKAKYQKIKNDKELNSENEEAKILIELEKIYAKQKESMKS